MTPEAACTHVSHRLGRRSLRAVPLSGGLLNHVYRVWLEGDTTVVVKHAPPYAAGAPELALDPVRATIEAQALAVLAGDTTPRILDSLGATLVLEDIGDHPDLITWLEAGGDPTVLVRLAHWLRALHDAPAPAIDNPSIQHTRLAVQYRPAGEWLAARGVPDASSLGTRLLELGRRFAAGGPVFVMGDLWPPSVRVRPDSTFVVLDWEFATRGHRAQDVGHLAAHLELEAAVGRIPHHFAAVFLDAYGPLSTDAQRDTDLHRAAEVLARTVGAFPRPGLSAATRDHLVDRAVQRIRQAHPPLPSTT